MQLLLSLTIILHVLWTLAIVIGVGFAVFGWFRRYLRWQLGYTLLVFSTLISWLVLDYDCLFTRWEEALRLRVAPETIVNGGFLYHYLGGGLERLGVSFGQDLFNLLIVGVLIVGLTGQLGWLVCDWWRNRRMNWLLGVIGVLLSISLGGFSMIAAQEIQAYLYPPLAAEDTLVKQGVVVSATDSELIVMVTPGETVAIRLGGITVIRATDGNGGYVTINSSAFVPGQIVHVTLDQNKPTAPARTIDIFAGDLSAFAS